MVLMYHIVDDDNKNEMIRKRVSGYSLTRVKNGMLIFLYLSGPDPGPLKLVGLLATGGVERRKIH